MPLHREEKTGPWKFYRFDETIFGSSYDCEVTCISYSLMVPRVTDYICTENRTESRIWFDFDYMIRPLATGCTVLLVARSLWEVLVEAATTFDGEELVAAADAE